MDEATEAQQYEVWREVWRITERRDGAIFGTEKIGEGWYPDAQVRANKSSETDLMYVTGGDNAPVVGIRVLGK